MNLTKAVLMALITLTGCSEQDLDEGFDGCLSVLEQSSSPTSALALYYKDHMDCKQWILDREYEFSLSEGVFDKNTYVAFYVRVETKSHPNITKLFSLTTSVDEQELSISKPYLKKHEESVAVYAAAVNIATLNKIAKNLDYLRLSARYSLGSEEGVIAHPQTLNIYFSTTLPELR